MSDIVPGLYDLLQTGALTERLEAAKLSAEWEDVADEEIRDRLVAHFAERIGSQLAIDLQDGLQRELLLDRIVGVLRADDVPISKALVAVGEGNLPRPETPLGLSALLTGTARSPSLRVQLERELLSCDRADWLVSFIKWSGIRPLLDALREFTRTPSPQGPRLRIATTSYMGATDVRAVEELLNLPNTEVRVSYDTHRTRLHAKAYLFHRSTGFGSAYIGSANLSKHAIDDGLEWTAKISEYQLSYLWRYAVATFESHWSDSSEFVPCTNDSLSELRDALQAQRASKQSPMTFFQLRPYRFQQAILDDIRDERDSGVNRHLVIAATGTGKTMIAGFDYQQFVRSANAEATMLFLAHREEILQQAQNTFRQVLRDGNFGELKTGTTYLTQYEHVFCTVQSWKSQLGHLPARHFKYIVLDEAHHAAADTYREILEYVRPESLLGLTATPERLDGLDIRQYFGGGYTHEIRLGDAIDRAHLVPFHYYGIADLPGLDLSQVKWRSNRYDASHLAEALCSAPRTNWVLEQTSRYVADIAEMRAIAFCATIRHAQFVADCAAKNGIQAIALTADSPQDVRRSVQGSLESGHIQMVCVVDLYNEGVDIKAVDVVLLMRPTESLTIFLQQIGRGLRLCGGKAHLTVLDFIAPQHERFNYADRFRAFTANRAKRIDRQIEAGMPYLPTGCLVHLERQAQKTILDNIQQATGRLKARRIQQELKALWQSSGSEPSLAQLMTAVLCDDPDHIYRCVLPSHALDQAIDRSTEIGPTEAKQLRMGLRRLLRTDDADMLKRYQEQLQGSAADEHLLALIHSVIWGAGRKDQSLAQTMEFLLARPRLRRDIMELLDWKRGHTVPRPAEPCHGLDGLLLHRCYTREQILLAAGRGSFQRPFSSREGVLHVPDRRLDIFFADINKSEADFSPTTMYDDYAISDRLFHWQSQSATHTDSAVGQRYIDHRNRGYAPLLFIRERKRDAEGLTMTYFCAGPLRYRRHSGNRPISFEWELESALPARVLEWAKQTG